MRRVGVGAAVMHLTRSGKSGPDSGDEMPITLADGLPTVFLRREAFEREGLLRSEIDSRFNLTDAEFRVEGSLIAIGPLPSDDMVGPLLQFLEGRGFVYFDDVFELSGNWPRWLRLYAM